MEDELGNTTPVIWFSFLGQSLSFLFPRSLIIYILYLPILTTTLENPESHKIGYQKRFSQLLAFLLTYLQSF
jgi:hypothetical protein